MTGGRGRISWGGPGTPSVALKRFWGRGGGPGTGRQSGPGPPPGSQLKKTVAAGGQERVLVPWQEEKVIARGRKGAQCPWQEEKSNCQGQRRVPAPLVGGKGSRRGRRRALVPLAMPEGWLLGWVGNKDTVQMVSAATACFPRAQFLPEGNTETHLGPCVGSSRFPPTTPAYPGRNDTLARIGAQ